MGFPGKASKQQGQYQGRYNDLYFDSFLGFKKNDSEYSLLYCVLF